MVEKKTKKAPAKKKVAATVELANQPSGGWPIISQGTHLTVKTYEDGSTELIWDDEQLLKEVREALASVKTVKPAVKAKANKKVPEAMKPKSIAITYES